MLILRVENASAVVAQGNFIGALHLTDGSDGKGHEAAAALVVHKKRHGRRYMALDRLVLLIVGRRKLCSLVLNLLTKNLKLFVVVVVSLIQNVLYHPVDTLTVVRYYCSNNR